MSDFLSTLVERSLAATGTVRPQLLSIFEPPAANGGAFFRGSESPGLPVVERHHEEPADQLSRSPSLGRAATPEPATPFVSASSKAGLTSRESTELPAASPPVRPPVDLREERPSEALSTAQRDAADAPETDGSGKGAVRPNVSPNAVPRMRPKIDLPEQHRSEARLAAHRDIADAVSAAETDGEGANAVRPDLPSTLPQARPQVKLPARRPSGTRSNVLRASVDSPKTDETGGGATPPELARASPEVRRRIGLARKQQTEARSSAHRGDTEAVTTKQEGVGAFQLPLSSKPTPGAVSVSQPVPSDPTRDRAHELRAEKIINLMARERDPHRELTPTRDLGVFPRRSPLPRPLAPLSGARNPVSPSINVTIGRIEVRATLPPLAPSKNTRAAAPSMNLEEYLRQRVAGNRR